MPLGAAEVCVQELRGSVANLSAADAIISAKKDPKGGRNGNGYGTRGKL